MAFLQRLLEGREVAVIEGDWAAWSSLLLKLLRSGWG